jgi:hypothetical protein
MLRQCLKIFILALSIILPHTNKLHLLKCILFFCLGVAELE